VPIDPNCCNRLNRRPAPLSADSFYGHKTPPHIMARFLPLIPVRQSPAPNLWPGKGEENGGFAGVFERFPV
jgi:hypothetical protein